jgi:hypothetical protein
MLVGLPLGGIMALTTQIQQILSKSREVELQFIDQISEELREERGKYENWSAKDLIAHVNYWPAVRSEQIEAWLEGKGVKTIPQFEQSNLECYRMFKDQTWDEVEQYSLDTYHRLSKLVKRLDEQALGGPSPDAEESKLWEIIVQVAYSHKLMHFSEFYIRRGEPERSGELWGDWAKLVAPLDTSESWQGRVRYNAACGLALAGDRAGALTELRVSLELQPGMKPWARRDPDLTILHDLPEFKELITTDYWWEALEAGPQAEAVADQCVRTMTMLREAVSTFPEEEWTRGDTNYQRPAGLALHIAQTIAMYSAQKPGESLEDPLMQVHWENPDPGVFPDRTTFLDFLDRVEQKLALLLKETNLESAEDQFPWTGSTKLSRILYTLRHTQHHLADMAMELARRGMQPPDWV